MIVQTASALFHSLVNLCDADHVEQVAVAKEVQFKPAASAACAQAAQAAASY